MALVSPNSSHRYPVELKHRIPSVHSCFACSSRGKQLR
ncbi:hypothetical protein CSUI_010209, partial [Cystoisospora suis]